jgi:hypothetical protein
MGDATAWLCVGLPASHLQLLELTMCPSSTASTSTGSLAYQLAANRHGVNGIPDIGMVWLACASRTALLMFFGKRGITNRATH